MTQLNNGAGFQELQQNKRGASHALHQQPLVCYAILIGFSRMKRKQNKEMIVADWSAHFTPE